MLPDFVSMLRAPMPGLPDGALRQGVEFHHDTDVAFHESGVFRRLQGRSFRELLERGIRRGPARAVAHVGVELLIDVALAWSLVAQENGGALGGVISCYSQALGSGASSLSSVHFLRPGDGDRLSFVCSRLSRAGVERFLVDSERAMDPLERALQHRPRLSLLPDESACVRRWANAMYPDVKSELPLLLAQLENALSLQLT